MKKTILSLFSVLVLSGSICAQSDNSYKSRNYKLSKNNYSINNERSKAIAIEKNNIDPEVNNYLSRNYKLNKKSNADQATTETELLRKDYQTMNHKLKNKPVPANSKNQTGINLVKFLTALLALSILMQ